MSEKHSEHATLGQIPARARALIEHNIAQCGQHLVGAYYAHPGFVYSIGLLDKVGFEMLAFVPEQYAGAILNLACEAAKTEGQELPYNVPVELHPQLPPVKFQQARASTVDERMGIGAKFYQKEEFPVVQVVLPDANGQFPEDPNYDHASMSQHQELLYVTLN